MVSYGIAEHAKQFRFLLKERIETVLRGQQKNLFEK